MATPFGFMLPTDFATGTLIKNDSGLYEVSGTGAALQIQGVNIAGYSCFNGKPTADTWLLLSGTCSVPGSYSTTLTLDGTVALDNISISSAGTFAVKMDITEDQIETLFGFNTSGNVRLDISVDGGVIATTYIGAYPIEAGSSTGVDEDLSRSLILDFIDNWGTNSYCGVRSVDIYNSDGVITITEDNAVFGASSVYAANWPASNAFVSSMSQTGSDVGGWLSRVMSEVRLYIVLPITTEITKIVVNNFHEAGNPSNSGMKNTTIYTSTSTSISSTYASIDDTYTKRWEGVLLEHGRVDGRSDQTILF